MPLSRINPAAYAELLDAKVAAYRRSFAGLGLPEPEVFASEPLHYRLRAEFRLWHHDGTVSYAMFDPADPRQPVSIEDFPVASFRICEAMPRLRAALGRSDELRRRAFQVEFLSTLSGELLVTLIYHRPLEEAWDVAARDLAVELDAQVIGRSRGQKRVVGRDWLLEAFELDGRSLRYQQIEGSFTQPNGGVNRHMLAWAMRQLRQTQGPGESGGDGSVDGRDLGANGLGVDSRIGKDRVGDSPSGDGPGRESGPGERRGGGDLLELYCGNGNFTIALAPLFDKVLATEVSKTSVRAAEYNLDANAVDNVAMVRMSSDEISDAMAGGRVYRRMQDVNLADYRFTTLFVDPPRAGLDEATLALARGFERILYISCNPATLRENVAALRATHRIAAAAAFDQFPYTDHLECGVLLQRRGEACF